MLSSDQPPTAIDPASTVASPAGVSTTPIGTDTGAVLALRRSVTLTVAEALVAPVKVSVTVPVCDGVTPDEGWTPTVRIDDPLPDTGETVSHDWLDAAVQLTVPVPDCVR